MKKTFLSITFLSSLVLVTSCGGGSSSDENNSNATPEASVNSGDAESDFSSITNANDASMKYKELLENYSRLLKDGNTEEAQKLKLELDQLKSFAESNFNSDELKALSELAKLSMSIENGDDIDLNNVLKSYEGIIDAAGKLPMSEEDQKDLDDAKKAINNMQNISEGLDDIDM